MIQARALVKVPGWKTKAQLAAEIVPCSAVIEYCPAGLLAVAVAAGIRVPRDVACTFPPTTNHAAIPRLQFDQALGVPSCRTRIAVVPLPPNA